MSIVNCSEADDFIERLPRCFQFYLVHGSDEGLAHERSKAIIRKILGGNPDPLCFVRLEGDEIARDPSLLAEEAYVGSIFGGSRAILIFLGNRDICSALSPLLASQPRDCAIVVRGTQVKTSLRFLIERMSNGVSIECCTDETIALVSLINREAKATPKNSRFGICDFTGIGCLADSRVRGERLYRDDDRRIIPACPV